MNRQTIFMHMIMIFSICISHVNGQNLNTENVFLITIDGLRWQELFKGADDSLITNKNYVKEIEDTRKKFGYPTADERRKSLMPWIWSTVAEQGQILGNRMLGNEGLLTNIHWFSYPGYSELLTGFTDPMINTNDKINNRNQTVLEWLHNKEGFQGKVAAFASWDVFPYIINRDRSGIYINAGFETAIGDDISEREKYLNELQPQTHSPWNSVRLDVFTHHYAKEYIKRKKPRVVYISYGEVDDFAHDSRYDHYLNAIHRTDRFIADLWNYCQSDSFYRNKTTFFITVDHGRGDIKKSEWTSHGKIYKGSNEIWMAVIGPDSPALGERKDKYRFFTNQTAATVAALLGYDYSPNEDAGKVLEKVIRKSGQ